MDGLGLREFRSSASPVAVTVTGADAGTWEGKGTVLLVDQGHAVPLQDKMLVTKTS